LFLSSVGISSSDNLALHPGRENLKLLLSKFVSRENHAAAQSLTQEPNFDTLLWFASHAAGLLGLSGQLLHRSGEELSSPAP
jgi:hypothetical protein